MRKTINEEKIQAKDRETDVCAYMKWLSEGKLSYGELCFAIPDFKEFFFKKKISN